MPIHPKTLNLVTYLVTKDHVSGLLRLDRGPIDTYATKQAIRHILATDLIWRRPEPPTHWVFVAVSDNPAAEWPHVLYQFPLDDK